MSLLSDHDIKEMNVHDLKRFLRDNNQRVSDGFPKDSYVERALYVLHKLKADAETEEEDSSSKPKTPNAIRAKRRSMVAGDGVQSRSLSRTRVIKKNTPISSAKKVDQTKPRRHSTQPAQQFEDNNNNNTTQKKPDKKLMINSNHKNHIIPPLANKNINDNSPVVQQSLRKTRSRMRRGTADAAYLKQATQKSNNIVLSSSIYAGKDKIDNDDHSDATTEPDDDDDDDDEEQAKQENRSIETEVQEPIQTIKYDIDQPPEMLTVKELKQWLTSHNIEYEMSTHRKQYYVDLVNKHCVILSKQPEPNISSPAHNNNAPFPRNLRTSPLTPNDPPIIMNNKNRSKTPKTEISPFKDSSGHQLTTPTIIRAKKEENDIREQIRQMFDDDMGYESSPGGGSYTTKGNYSGESKGSVKSNKSDYKGEKSYSSEKLQPDKRDNFKNNNNNNKNDFIRAQFDLESPQRPLINDKNSINSQSNNKNKNENENENKQSIIDSPFENIKKRIPFSLSNKIGSAFVSITSSVKKPKEELQDKTSINQQKEEPIPAAAKKMPASIKSSNDGTNIENESNQRQNSQKETNVSNRGHGKRKSSMSNIEEKLQTHKTLQPISIQSAKTPPPKLVENIRKAPKNEPVENDRKLFAASECSTSQFRARPAPTPNNFCCSTTKCLVIISVVVVIISAVLGKMMPNIPVLSSVSDKMVNYLGLMPILQSLGVGLHDQILFCDKGGLTVGGRKDQHGNFIKCTTCPANAANCIYGHAYCSSNYILMGKHCVLNRDVIRLAHELQSQIIRILGQLRGRHSCGESIDYRLNENGLKAQLNIDQPVLLEEAFAYFKEHLLPETAELHFDNNRYYSNKEIRSFGCELRYWMIGNSIMVFFIGVALFLIILICFKYQQKKNFAQYVQTLVGKTYEFLEDSARFQGLEYVPIVNVEASLAAKNKNAWDKVVAIMEQDNNVLKSQRVVNGIQRKCWKLATYLNRSLNAQSPVPQQQQFPNNFYSVNSGNNPAANISQLNQSWYSPSRSFGETPAKSANPNINDNLSNSIHIGNSPSPGVNSMLSQENTNRAFPITSSNYNPY